MALWNRAGTYYVKLTAPDGTLIRRTTGTTDRLKAEEYHDKLKAELWDLARLKIKPKRTWDGGLEIGDDGAPLRAHVGEAFAAVRRPADF